MIVNFYDIINQMPLMGLIRHTSWAHTWMVWKINTITKCIKHVPRHYKYPKGWFREVVWDSNFGPVRFSGPKLKLCCENSDHKELQNFSNNCLFLFFFMCICSTMLVRIKINCNFQEGTWVRINPIKNSYKFNKNHRWWPLQMMS